MLERAARAACRLLHGNRRSRDGYLLTWRCWMDDDQEVRAGKSYLGLPFALLFFANAQYVLARYGHEEHGKRVFSFRWPELPAEEKILLPLSILCFLIAFASAVRGVFVYNEVIAQRREELGE